MALRLPEIVDRCMYITGDKGYDDTKMTTKLWDEYRIKPVMISETPGETERKRN